MASTRSFGIMPASGFFFSTRVRISGVSSSCPARWIRDSVTASSPHLIPGADNPASSSSLGFGYQWWLPERPDGDYCAIGTCGQFIYVHPRYRVVIAKTSADADDNPSGDEKDVESLAVFRSIAADMARHP